MQTQKIKMLPTLETTIEKARQLNISDERIQVLNPLIEYIQSKIDQGKDINLNCKKRQINNTSRFDENSFTKRLSAFSGER